MPSHMEVQRIATERNALAEMLVDFILQHFANQLYEEGYITEEVSTEQQKSFVREDCSEVYDHFIELPLSKKLDPTQRKLQIWAQTTCYKGNPQGKPESNKTYEIRETLVEALTLRRWLTKEKKFFRTIHFTLGPSNYTYGWFLPAKKNAFDLSLYPTYAGGSDIFERILTLGKSCVYEYEFYEKIEDIMEDEKDPLFAFINSTVADLKAYFVNGYKTCDMADKQAKLLNDYSVKISDELKLIVECSKNSGMDIKGKTVKLLEGENVEDKVLGETLKRIVSTNPFLPVAIDALGNWEDWSKETFDRPSKNSSLRDYIKDLWSEKNDSRMVIHRLLMRIYTSESISYIQDVNIDGLDEHNLYNGNHTSEQIEEITTYINDRCIENGIESASELYSKLCSSSAKALVRASLKFEQINGTSLKPSFYYLEEYLKPTYELVSFDQAHLPAPIAYYSKFATGLNVKPYDNLKVIRNKSTKKNLAIVKGKYFRKPEFPRRVKEESYVGLTAQFDLNDSFDFYNRYSNLPFIMFVDMATGYTPPEFAVKRLATIHRRSNTGIPENFWSS